MSKPVDTGSSAERSPTITTEKARTKLEFEIHRALSNASNTLIDAPTALGKTYLVATTPWRKYPDVTGGEPVIHFHETTTTRDDAAEKSEAAGISSAVVESGLDICPVAQGEFDDALPSIEGQSAGKWLKRAVEYGNYRFSKAHKMLTGRIGTLPCSEGDTNCTSRRDLSQFTRDEDGTPRYDVVHATNKFAHVEEFVADANLVFDEQPAFNREITETEVGFILRSVDELLEKAESDLSWNELVQSVREEDVDRLDTYREFLDGGQRKKNRSYSGYWHGDTRAIAGALTEAERKLVGRRYLGEARGTSLVLNSQGNLRQLHQPPDLSEARCVIGLDAHPSPHLWRLHTVDDLREVPVLSDTERQRWRRDHRSLEVIRVGNNTRSYTRGWRGKHAKSDAGTLINALRDHYGAKFRTCISPKSVNNEVCEMLEAAGVDNPDTMYFGHLKSRNEFTGETVGFIVGCIDPGDERILDLLAFCGLNALPNRKFAGKGGRTYGREFIGPDADAAEEFLASVRENNLAQAVGRYARDPTVDGPDATVYVWSAALPDSLTDDIVPGVTNRVTDKKDKITQFVRREGTVTKRDVVAEFEDESEEDQVSATYAYEVLQALAEQGVVTISERTGYYGADEYQYVSGTIRPRVDLGW